MRNVLFLMWVAVLVATGHSEAGSISRGDTLEITIKGVPVDEQNMINGKYHVGDSGKIKVPIVGVLVTAAGLSNDALERKIEKVLKEGEIYKEPVIEVIMQGKDQPVVNTVNVGGQVKRTGDVQWVEGLTLYAAINKAGGATPFASPKVQLTRNGKMMILDLKKEKNQNILVKVGDRIHLRQVKPFEKPLR